MEHTPVWVFIVILCLAIYALCLAIARQYSGKSDDIKHTRPDSGQYRRTFRKSYERKYTSLERGQHGEYLAFKELENFTEHGGRFLFNLYLPTADGGTTEVDIVFIHPKGLFVIESKNYNGWIFGNERHRYWTQTLPKGYTGESHKEKFYNPLRQNASHIKHLKRLLAIKIEVWSIIVFSDDCVFKKLVLSADSRHKVINLYELNSVVSGIINGTENVVFSETYIEYIYDKLCPCSQVSDETRMKHREKILRARAK